MDETINRQHILFENEIHRALFHYIDSHQDNPEPILKQIDNDLVDSLSSLVKTGRNESAPGIDIGELTDVAYLIAQDVLKQIKGKQGTVSVEMPWGPKFETIKEWARHMELAAMENGWVPEDTEKLENFQAGEGLPLFSWAE